MKLKNPDKFVIKPRIGVIDPCETVEIEVTTQQVTSPDIFRFDCLLIGKCPEELRQQQTLNSFVSIFFIVISHFTLN